MLLIIRWCAVVKAPSYITYHYKYYKITIYISILVSYHKFIEIIRYAFSNLRAFLLYLTSSYLGEVSLYYVPKSILQNIHPEHFGVTRYKYIINNLYGKLNRTDIIICKINHAYFAISSESI